MVGTKTRGSEPLPRDLSLEEPVSKAHFYRRLEAQIDLFFVRELVPPLYAGGGRPSVDPLVFFKLRLVMFFEDLRLEPPAASRRRRGLATCLGWRSPAGLSGPFVPRTSSWARAVPPTTNRSAAVTAANSTVAGLTLLCPFALFRPGPAARAQPVRRTA